MEDSEKGVASYPLLVGNATIVVACYFTYGLNAT